MDNVIIDRADNVAVSLKTGHKTALTDIAKGQAVIKYGYPIGLASKNIKKDEHVHIHNLVTGLGEVLDYEYKPDFTQLNLTEPATIEAYVRSSGEIGIRNDIWIINTVGCVNKTAEKLAALTGAFNFSHPYGCSQLGDDQRITQLILKGLIKHPNAGGVLVLGLGCENNNIEEMKKFLGTYDSERVRFLTSQECVDETEEGIRIIEELKKIASRDKRQKVGADRLKIGLKCGGSDGLSGITANPVAGHMTDRLCAMGASALLTEVPEMFGAEELLFKRCVNKAVFDKAAAMVNNYKNYFLNHGQPIY
ncbi:MAG TPA: UxaA family hydrolase, partial [Oscillospiraceae bacterium]|nr:UxaA family hydrolase [Oscillospiraceae bacterium]